MEPIMKLLASRDLFMCTLGCKTETWLAMDQTMSLLARRQFMSTLRWIPVTSTKIKFTKNVFVPEYIKRSTQYKTTNIYAQHVYNIFFKLLVILLIHLTMFVSLR